MDGAGARCHAGCMVANGDTWRAILRGRDWHPVHPKNDEREDPDDGGTTCRGTHHTLTSAGQGGQVLKESDQAGVFPQVQSRARLSPRSMEARLKSSAGWTSARMPALAARWQRPKECPCREKRS